jgi:glycosyltransferase involved in cell wall biosynthesis
LSSSSYVIWSCDYSETNGQAIVTDFVVRSIEEINWEKFIYQLGFSGIWKLPLLIFRLYLHLATHRRSTVYVVSSRSFFGFIRDIPILWLSMLGFRVIAHSHGSDIVTLLSSGFMSPFARFLYRRCVVIVPSEHLLDQLRELKCVNVRVCENFTTFLMDYEIENEVSEDGVFTVLWNSNIISSKGVFDVATAVMALNGRGYQIELIALGQVVPDEEMTRAEAQCKLDQFAEKKWFRYVGRVPSDTVLAWLRIANVVCLPSRYRSECQPLAAIQAMCHGLPLVLADTLALHTTAGEYPAIYVQSGSVEEICTAIIQSMGSYADHKVLADNSLIARRRFSKEKFGKTMLSVLTDDSNY